MGKAKAPAQRQRLRAQLDALGLRPSYARFKSSANARALTLARMPSPDLMRRPNDTPRDDLTMFPATT